MVFEVFLTGDEVEVRMDVSGCQYTLICARVASFLAQGKTLAQARRDTTPQAIISAIENLPEHNHHCALMASQALADALTQAAVSRVDPWRKLYRPRDS
jgi:NifU-like protein involved in Fe-S cluster formation